MADMLAELQGLRHDMADNQSKTDTELKKANSSIAKNTLAINELPLSVMRLSEQIADFAQHEQLLKKLEGIVLKRMDKKLRK